MMTVAPTAIDLDGLRHTLRELGYNEIVTNESAPLVHHILSDLNLASQQYTDLLRHYDDLFVRWQQQQQNKQQSEGKNASMAQLLDLSRLSDIDMSFLGGGGQLDESFMLRTVEEARQRIDALSEEAVKAKEESENFRKQNESLKEELKKSQMTSQELSHLLQTKSTTQEAMQKELSALKDKKNESTVINQIIRLVKTAIGVLPSDLQPAFTARLGVDSIESLCAVLSDVILRLKREMESINISLKEAKNATEKLRKQSEDAEESSFKIKAMVTNYQGQIADLMGKLHQHEFERGLQADLAAQLASLESINNIIKDKLASLEYLKHHSSVNV